MTKTTSQTMKKQPVVAVPGVVAGRGPDLEDSAAVVRPPAYVRGTALSASLKGKDMVRREEARAVLVR